LLFIAMSTVNILLGARLTKRASNLDIPSAKLNGLLIALLVMGILGGFIIAIFAIVALCMKDKEEENMIEQSSTSIEQSPINGITAEITTSIRKNTIEFQQTLARFKIYKADGVITDAQFKQKVDEIVKKYFLAD